MFNESQLEAINHIDGPALVLAGPGSGKTTVITRRTKKLIEEGVSPDNIYEGSSSRNAGKIYESDE